MADNRDLIDALQQLVATTAPADTSASLLSALLNTNNILSLLVLKTGAVAASASRLSSTASTNATNIKATAGKLYGITAYNTNASARFLKLYDKRTAPTVGTDIPIVTFVLPATTLFSPILAAPIPFNLGISYAITGLVADTDTTAITAYDVNGTMLYV